MFSSIFCKFKYGKHCVILESGIIARQSTISVMASMDGTKVLVTVVINKKIQQEQKFLPLVINYQERCYAAGRFPGGFFRREGRFNEIEILTSRLIDRSIRPLFSLGFFNEIQITVTVLSFDPKIHSDIISIIGVSAALSLLGIPFNGPLGIARVGYIDNYFVLNPSKDELKNSKLDLIVSGTSDAILMVESESKFFNEKEILKAIIFGHKCQQLIINNINKLVIKFNRLICFFKIKKINKILLKLIFELIKNRFYSCFSVYKKQERSILINTVKFDVLNYLIIKNYCFNKNEIEFIINFIEKKIIQKRLLNGKLRIDGRKKNIIRELDIRTNILLHTHGSSLFTRGETQVLVTITLGTDRNSQNFDELTGDRIDRFLLHYNFPPFCVGDIGVITAPKRREIGHGCLVKKGLLSVMPIYNLFPYTIRVVSEVMESNGSSSMASICGSSLALMDAGVPIKFPVAGIAMGLIKKKERFIIISDISGDEDHMGDMDFKVSGSYNGITSLQMDIKIKGITYDIIKKSLNHAKNARFHILKIMNKIIENPRDDISIFAPRIYIIKINPERIKDLIGKGGSVIRSLTEETGTIIEVENNGTVKIASIKNKSACYAIKRIKQITTEIEVGHIYKGTVIRIVTFGAFVSICGGKEGLVHISKISNTHVEKVCDYLEINQKILVKVLEIDNQGRIRLSMRDVNNIN